MKITVVLGTGRSDRQSEKVFEYLKSVLGCFSDVDFEFVDVRDFSSEFTVASWVDSEIYSGWRKIATDSDGFLILSPEYNWGYPGELKHLLDSALDEYKGKPVSLCTVSAGALGGPRVSAQLIQIFAKLKMVFVGEPVYFLKVKELFDSSGAILDSEFDDRVKGLVESLVSYAKLLKESKS